MTEEPSGRRIVVPETRELGQLVRMLEELGADTVPCPMIAIRDAPDAAPVEAWLRRFADGRCDDLVLMTGEGLRRLLGFARRINLESAFIAALRLARKITRGPKPVRALREVGLAADMPADEPTTEGIVTTLGRHDLAGQRVDVHLYPGNANERLLKFLEASRRARGFRASICLRFGSRRCARDRRDCRNGCRRYGCDRLYKCAPGSTVPRCRTRLRSRSGTAARFGTHCRCCGRAHCCS